MSITRKITFIMYGIIGLSLLGTGIRYFFSSEIMSYHLAAMGVSSWSELAPNVQVMTLNFVRAAGLGFFTAASSILVLLIFPFRKGEAWARYAIAAITLAFLGVLTGIMLSVRASTPGNPPVFAVVPLIILAVCACILSFRK